MLGIGYSGFQVPGSMFKVSSSGFQVPGKSEKTQVSTSRIAESQNRRIAIRESSHHKVNLSVSEVCRDKRTVLVFVPADPVNDRGIIFDLILPAAIGIRNRIHPFKVYPVSFLKPACVGMS